MSAWGASSPLRSCDALIERIEQNDPTLTDLVILPTKTFGAEQVARLCMVLERHRSNANTHWKSLSASGHAIPVPALRRLGNAIATTKAVNFRSIAIGDRNMGDEGVSAFCEALREGDHSLEYIDLSFKGMGSDGFHAVLRTLGKDSGLKHLDLSRNPGICSSNLSDFNRTEGDSSETRIFPGVGFLDLTECGILGPLASQLFPMLVPTSTTMRRTLRLSKNPFGVQGMEALKGHFLSSRALYLSNCGIGDEGMVKLHSLCDGPSCDTTVLELSRNSIGGEGISRLAKCLSGHMTDGNEPFLKNIEELVLAGNNLGEEGTVILIENGLKPRSAMGLSSLKVLDLSETKCGIEGAVLALTQSSAASLRLFNNNLGSDGFRALAAVVKAGFPSNLESLDLSGNNAELTAVLELLDSVLKNETISSNVPSRLKSLVIGGNQCGPEVEDMIHRIREVRPDMDIARDKRKKMT